MKAYCWASGQIEFGRRLPTGAILMATGPSKLLRNLVGVTARLAYDNKTLLVPGIPEASNQDQGMDALEMHLAWVAKGERDPRIVFNVYPGTCRVCGCSQNHACARGCSWVVPGLCSSCAKPEARA